MTIVEKLTQTLEENSSKSHIKIASEDLKALLGYVKLSENLPAPVQVSSDTRINDLEKALCEIKMLSIPEGHVDPFMNQKSLGLFHQISRIVKSALAK